MLIKNRKLMHLYYQCTKQAYIRPFFREVKKKTRKVREINKVFANDFSAYPLSKPDLASEFFRRQTAGYTAISRFLRFTISFLSFFPRLLRLNKPVLSTRQALRWWWCGFRGKFFSGVRKMPSSHCRGPSGVRRHSAGLFTVVVTFRNLKAPLTPPL